ncbi:hypothetical protein GCM10010425_22210 [Streptomyces spororaveus]
MAGQVDGDRAVPEEAEFRLEGREGEGVRECSVHEYERRLQLFPHFPAAAGAAAMTGARVRETSRVRGLAGGPLDHSVVRRSTRQTKPKLSR